MTSNIEISDETYGLENEELILRNTYINAMLLPLVPPATQPSKEKHEETKVKWADNKSEQKVGISSVIPDQQFTGEAVIVHRTISKQNLKSIFRPSTNEIPGFHDEYDINQFNEKNTNLLSEDIINNPLQKNNIEITKINADTSDHPKQAQKFKITPEEIFVVTI